MFSVARASSWSFRLLLCLCALSAVHGRALAQAHPGPVAAAQNAHDSGLLHLLLSLLLVLAVAQLAG